jgi:hypothetical protein
VVKYCVILLRNMTSFPRFWPHTTHNGSGQSLPTNQKKKETDYPYRLLTTNLGILHGFIPLMLGFCLILFSYFSLSQFLVINLFILGTLCVIIFFQRQLLSTNDAIHNKIYEKMSKHTDLAYTKVDIRSS